MSVSVARTISQICLVSIVKVMQPTKTVLLAPEVSLARRVVVRRVITYPAHLIAEAHIGQLSALVYRDNPAKASTASEAVRLYGPLGSVRMLLQLAIAAISPIRQSSAPAVQIRDYVVSSHS